MTRDLRRYPRRRLLVRSAPLLRLAAVVLVVLSSTGCQPEARPTQDEWLATWHEARALVPEPGDLEGEGGKDECHDLLVGARKLEHRLIPGLTAQLDVPVSAWIDKAEQIGFECRAQHDHAEITRRELRELAVLTAEVEAGVQALQALQGDEPL